MERNLGKWTEFVVKNHIIIILFFLSLAFISWFGIKNFELQSDFSAILPQDYESVKLLKEISKRVGGLGMLNIGIETDDLNSGKRFVEDLNFLIKKILSGEIKFIESNAKEVKRHYEKFGLLYLSKEDLIRLKNELRDWINRKKLELSPFYFSLEEEEEFRFEDLKQRYTKFLSRFENYIDGYYTGEGGRLFAIFIQPRYTPTDISNTRKFIKKVEDIINELNPRSYHASMKAGLAGNHKIAVEEYDAVRRDIASTFLLCVLLIGGIIFFFFRRLRVLFLLTITLVSGIFISFGILSIFIKKIVVMTGFLGSIVMGTGINYGIIQLARYFEERLDGKKVVEAIDIAINKTFLQTLASALTTAGGFFVLSFALTRSFKEFGIMGSLGIVLCWMLTYSFLPALLYLFEKIKPFDFSTSGWRKPVFFIPSAIADRIAYYYRPFLLLIPISILSSLYFIKFLPDCLEYNFENLRSKMSLRSGTAVIDERISRILKKSSTPAIIPVESMEEGKEVCEVLREDSEKYKGKIGKCVNIYSLLPDDQKSKIKIVEEIYNLIKDIDEKWLDEKKAEELRKFKKLFEEVRPFGINEIPDILRRQFSDAYGNIGTLVYVNPPPGKNLWNANNLFNFTESLREINLPNGKIIKTSGEAIIFADILKSIERDAPFLSILAFIAITIFVFLIFRSIKDTFYIITSLVCALSWMFGLIALFDLKFNFLNFVAIPTAMGTGVDYAINIYQRAKIDGRKGTGYVLHKTGSAVLLCSLTTIIGYLVLITADTQILASYGELAIIAELTCLFSALFLLNALLRLLKKLPP